MNNYIDEVLTKAFNDFYDYMTERDILKAAHEYSEKTVFKEAKAALEQYVLSEKVKLLQGLLQPINCGRPDCKRTHTRLTKGYIKRYLEQLALQAKEANDE